MCTSICMSAYLYAYICTHICMHAYMQYMYVCITHFLKIRLCLSKECCIVCKHQITGKICVGFSFSLQTSEIESFQSLHVHKAILSDEGKEQWIKTEIYIPKSVGAMAQPCLTPHFRLNASVSLPLKSTPDDMLL